MTVSLNRARAAIVVSRLERAYAERRGILESLDDLVENQLPVDVTPLSEAHARFLFYTVPNDHGVRSRLLYARAKQLFHETPVSFSPQAVLATYSGPDDAGLVEDVARRLGVRFPREAAKSWYVNSERLERLFQGSVLDLFSSAIDAQVLFQKITSFRGFGAKTGGMLLRAVVGLGFAELQNVERVLIPVDVHDVRIAFWTGMVSLPDDVFDEKEYQPFAKHVQQALTTVCRHVGAQWPNVDRALWLIGSRGCTRRLCRECPLSDLCSVGSVVVADTVR